MRATQEKRRERGKAQRGVHAALLVALALLGGASGTNDAFAQVAALQSAPLVAERTEVTIGIVDTFSPDFYVNTYSATLEHLVSALPKYKFKFVEVSEDHLTQDVKRLAPNFLVTSASNFVSLIEPFGAHQVATRKPDWAADASHTVGAAFVVRRESAVQKLSDLANRRIAAVSERSFDGWLIAAGEIVRHGHNPETFFQSRVFTDYSIPDPALLVRMGIADVAVLSACSLENLEASGELARGELRVLEDRSLGKGCRRSTALYPDAVFSSLATVVPVAPDVVRDVTVALLTMPHAGRGYEWTIADDFVPTYSLLKDLRLPPYSAKPLTVREIWAAWRTEILLVLMLIAAVIFHIVTVNLLVRRRTQELRASLAERQQFFEEVQVSRSKLALLERFHVVSFLSGLFAHEIKQPLMNISLYAEALKLLLKKEGALSARAEDFIDRVKREVERSSDIVEHVRGYAKKRETRREPLALGAVVKEGVRLAAVKVPIEVKILDNANVLADPFELQFMVTNFLKNAAAAVKDVPKPKIVVTVSREAERALVAVEDNGPALTDEAFAALGTMGKSTKEDGLGFGLAIAAGLAERAGGHVAFERVSPQGLRVKLVLACCM